MKPHAVDGRWRRARSPAGFSLAEMMIALAILGMGLLVIGAALPIGIRYTRASVNKATGEAAAEYALDVIEQNVCLRGTILDPDTMPPTLIREPGLFQPRSPTTGLPDPTYEPLIKVRPLYVRAINAAPGAAYGQQEPDIPNRRIRSEEVAYSWLAATLASFDTREVDPGGAPQSANLPAWMRWTLPSVATVYPPISSDVPFFPNDFFYNKYEPRPVRSPWSSPTGSETLKALDRRIVWTAFYRRVSYEPGSDPALYEFIVVALRVPGAGYRFPVQAPPTSWQFVGSDGGESANTFAGESGELTVAGQGNLGPSGGYGSAATGGSGSGGGQGGGDGNAMGGSSGDEIAAPIPWMVSFTSLPAPPGGPMAFNADGYPLDRFNQPIVVGGANAPATLTFRCAFDRSGLFPVGAIFIPARNDFQPYLMPMPQRRVGFGPPAPTALPIYEVTERPDDETVIVKFNGYYPMKGTPGLTQLGTPLAHEWPVWVVPPAFAEYQDGNPVAPDQSQIVAVARRYIRLREVP